jgi:hypothetical protein
VTSGKHTNKKIYASELTEPYTLAETMSPPAPLDVDLVGVTDTSAVTIPDPLTVNGVSGWREKTAKMPTGVAASSSSDMFKSPV